MLLEAFCLLDTKTGIHAVPIFVPHSGQALRMASDVASDLSTSYGRHPEDFVLIRIGSYDDQTGIMSATVPVSFGNLTGFLKRSVPSELFREMNGSPENGRMPSSP